MKNKAISEDKNFIVLIGDNNNLNSINEKWLHTSNVYDVIIGLQ